MNLLKNLKRTSIGILSAAPKPTFFPPTIVSPPVQPTIPSQIPLRNQQKRKTVFNFSSSIRNVETKCQELQTISPEKEIKNVSLEQMPDDLFENKLRDKEYQKPNEGSKIIQIICQNQDVRDQKYTYLRNLVNNLKASSPEKVIVNLSDKPIKKSEKEWRKFQRKLLSSLKKNEIAIVDEDYGFLDNGKSKEQQGIWDKNSITPSICVYLKDDGNIKDNNIYYPEKSYQEKLFHSIRDYTLYQELDARNEQKLVDQLSYLVNLNHLWYLLDTRRITSLPKQKMRPLYNMWHARINSQVNENPFSGESFVIDGKGKGDYQVSEQERDMSKCHFDHMNKIFNKDGFSVPRHIPYVLGNINNQDAFHSYIDPKYLHQDMAIKFPGTDYRIPKELEKVSGEFTEQVSNFFKAQCKYHDDMYAYLTFSKGIQEPFLAQRRPGMHADGFKSYLTHEEGEINDTVFIACSAVCPVFYIENFETENLDAGRDDFWCNFSSQCKDAYWDGLRPYEIAMIDGFNLHSVAVNKSFQTFERIFIRIMYSVSKYDRLGNLKNPLFDYDWDMKPQPIQMPPVFWNQRQPQYDQQKDVLAQQRKKEAIENGEKIFYYSDGLWDTKQA